MTTVATPKSFFKYAKRLSIDRQEEVVAAISGFIQDPTAARFNLEKVKNRAGYWTIRSSYGDRILLRQADPADPGPVPDGFEAVPVGNHDLMYKTYFRK